MENTQYNNAESGISFEAIARVCHEANRQYCLTIGDTSQPIWELAPDWQKESAINGVRFHFLTNNTTPADSHKSWLKKKTEQGWAYGEVKDPENKLHPYFTAYENLPIAQQRKDYIFKGIVDAFKSAYEVGNIKELTFGQKAVGLTFNPSFMPEVDSAKQFVADAIDLLTDAHNKAIEVDKQEMRSTTWVRNVFRTEAFTSLINAQMALVKYLTWKE